jgi:hypothetical protein
MPQQPQNSAASEAQAQACIEAARREGGTVLDLSGLRLRTIPESVLDLPGLGNWAWPRTGSGMSPTYSGGSLTSPAWTCRATFCLNSPAG